MTSSIFKVDLQIRNEFVLPLQAKSKFHGRAADFLCEKNKGPIFHVPSGAPKSNLFMAFLIDTPGSAVAIMVCWFSYSSGSFMDRFF
jgi:hypothetical protein